MDSWNTFASDLPNDLVTFSGESLQPGSWLETQQALAESGIFAESDLVPADLTAELHFGGDDFIIDTSKIKPPPPPGP